MDTVASLETPVPLVDLDRLERNLSRAARYAADHGLALRPHVKTHKSPFIAARQVQSGARGLTCATPRELEVMGAVSDNLLLAYPALGPKVDRLMQLPEHVGLTVALDSTEAVDQLAAAADRTIGVYVELDAGMHRVGAPSVDAAIAVIDRVLRHDALTYAGVAFYPGHIRQPVAEQNRHLAELDRWLSGVLDALHDARLDPLVVSGGSTPTIWRTHELRGVTEFRSGTYVYNDRTTAAIGACDAEDCAMTILATVVSTAVPGQAVIDAGSKALAREPMRGAPGEGFGNVLGHPEVLVTSMSEEHGILDLSAVSWRPRVGELVRIVPNHVCVAMCLHERVFGVRGETVETSWDVAARGRLSIDSHAATRLAPSPR